MKIVLEPLFEADFQQCSFGFRPKRSAHDANEVIRQTVNNGCNWVVDADIKDYFGTIDQKKLMVLLKRRISDRRMLKLIRKFLRAGVLEDGQVRSAVAGTPQGGELSPLLANVYLNYLDKIWTDRCKKIGVLVHYADDRAVLCRSEELAQEALRRLNIVTDRLGLALHPEKTRVVNLWDGKDGFDFLGFHHRKVRSWRYKRYYLQDAKSRLSSMGVMYDKLYRSENYREMSVREYLPPLIREIVDQFPNGEQTAIETDLADFRLSIRVIPPLGLIINELVTNAMKYAFKDRDGGVIRVSASSVEGRATIAFEDDGSGIPESMDIEKSGGFGLKLVSMLIEQLEGSIRIERNNGSRFILEFAI